MGVAGPVQPGDGLRSYYESKVEELELRIRTKQHDLKRLEAQRNELNSRGAPGWQARQAGAPDRALGPPECRRRRRRRPRRRPLNRLCSCSLPAPPQCACCARSCSCCRSRAAM